MRIFLFLIIALLFQSRANAQFRDSFDDGELNTDPAWTYNSGDFRVVSGRLNTANAAGGTVRYAISAKQTPDTADWISFTFQYSFNPSSQNYTEFFFSADSSADLARNGYFIRAGDLRDEISLYRLQNGTRTEIISGLDGELNKTNNHYTVVLERQGDTLILRRLDVNSSTWFTEGKTHAPGFRTLGWTGIHVVQNGTSVIGRHFFDNIYIGLKPRDTVAPRMISADFVPPASVRVNFSEPVSNPLPTQFSLPPYTVLSALADVTRPSAVILQLNQIPAYNQTFTLTNSGTADLTGNTSKTHSLGLFTRFYDTAGRGDLIFTEVMAAPSPPVAGLPDAEYIEIFNPTARVFTLNNCSLSDAGSSAKLPDTAIFPGQYLTLSRSSFPAFAAFGPWAGLSSFPSLNNDNDIITLRNHRGELICRLQYTDAWHTDAVKKTGGWSLERIDTSYACIDEGNWTSNTGTGGTPGRSNAVAGKLSNTPQNFITDIFVPAPDETEIHFINPVDSARAVILSNYNLKSGSNSLLRFAGIGEDGRSVRLKWNGNFNPNTVEHLSVQGLKYCSRLGMDSQTIAFGYADTGRATGLHINEILFNPAGEGADYVEIYNSSPRIIDMGEVQFASADEQFRPSQTTGPLKARSLLPGAYLVLTTKPEQVSKSYSRHNRMAMMTMESLPSMPNDEGRIMLISNTAETLDSLHYDEDFHAPLLADADGVSLEKVKPDAPANRRADWTSAAASAGFGTPGLPNSQLVSAGQRTDQPFSVEQPVVSPDNDGISDLLGIRYSLPSPGFLLTVSIFNEQGFHVARPFSNYLLEQAGSVYWDVNTGSGLLAPGNYIIRAEAFHPSGQTTRGKLLFSVNAVVK